MIEFQDKPDCPMNFQNSGLPDLTDKKPAMSNQRTSSIQIDQRIARREVQWKKGMTSMTNTSNGRFRIELPAFGNKTFRDEEASNV